MVTAKIVAVGIVLVASFLNAAGENPQTYRNQEFGILVRAPEGSLLCPTNENVHDHGPVFLLGATNAKNCDDLERSRSIEIFAAYNVADVTKKLEDFLKWECHSPCHPRS